MDLPLPAAKTTPRFSISSNASLKFEGRLLSFLSRHPSRSVTTSFTANLESSFLQSLNDLYVGRQPVYIVELVE